MQQIRPGIDLPIHQIADHPFDFAALFPGLTRIECEVGFCSAIFLTEYANRNPRTGILGIEKKHAYFLRGLHNLERKLKQDNVKAVEFDARPLIEMLIPPASLDILHIYFPDPWPKKRHISKRMLNRDNFRMFHEKLKPGGRLSFATDHPGYAEFIDAELPFVVDLYTRLPYGRADREVMTKWERKQTDKGIPINYYLLEKKGLP
ncbi:MAG TPA: hypothetical protein PLV42_11595 [bacterium]|nr:hypothetical protein [bacterium]